MEITERLGDGFGVHACVLDVVPNRLAIGTKIDHNVIAQNAIVHRRARSELDITPTTDKPGEVCC